VEGHAEAFPGLRTQRDYIEEFTRFALHVRARYAVPFASNHCFLHRDTYGFNSTAVSPEDVRSFYAPLARTTGSESECVVMTPGSRWSEAGGFEVRPFDYAARAAHIETLREKHAATLDSQYQREIAVRTDAAAGDRYLADFMRALPWLLRRRLKQRVTLRVGDATGDHCWILEFVTGAVRRAAVPDIDAPVIDIPAAVFNDCVNQRMFSVWGASKRLRIRLRSSAQLGAVNMLVSLLDFYELDMLPLRRNFSARSLAVRLRRWRDAVEAGSLVLRHRVLGRRFDVAALYELPAANEGR
jgi:UDP-MurNAc hydroxylase